ncbi:MAG: amidohydrolase family protein [Deltaproteobacteria bacterium]
MSEIAIYAASWLISTWQEPVPGGAIAVRDGVITSVGTLSQLQLEYCGAAVVEYPGCAILPGLVNAHTHLELTHFPSWRLRTALDYNPGSFVEWLVQMVKVKRGLEKDDYAASVREGLRICLESGTTSVGDIVCNPALTPLYRSSRLSGRLFFELLGHDPQRFQTTMDQALAVCDTPDNSTLLPGLSPHAPYTIAEENLPAVRDAALSRRLPLAIHLSESIAERDFIFDATGHLAETLYPLVGWERYIGTGRRCSSTELLDRAGLLTPSTLAIHCVHLTQNDLAILGNRGVNAVLCPRSNERLDVGLPPIELLKKGGIPLSLGTDSLASNDSLSMWDEMRFALDSFPHDLSPREVFQMATCNAADALKTGDTCGSLSVGKRADFQVIGDLGTTAEKLLERILQDGKIHEVYAGGERYCGQEF